MPKRLIRSVIAGRPLHTASGATTVLAAAQKMASLNIGALLVVDGDTLTGIFSERDALTRVLAKGLDAGKTTLAQVMTAKPFTISADKPLSHALLIMHDSGFRHMPVLDGGKLIGMVSVRDALGPEMSELDANIAQRESLAEHMR
jgi:CBS domain-containing protein